jgi:hypothetical protein
VTTDSHTNFTIASLWWSYLPPYNVAVVKPVACFTHVAGGVATCSARRRSATCPTCSARMSEPDGAIAPFGNKSRSSRGPTAENQIGGAKRRRTGKRFSDPGNSCVGRPASRGNSARGPSFFHPLKEGREIQVPAGFSRAARTLPAAERTDSGFAVPGGSARSGAGDKASGVVVCRPHSVR